MFGVIIGTAAVMGLAYAVGRRAEGGCAGRHHGMHRWRGRHRGGHGSGVDYVADRIDATNDQRRVLREAHDAVRGRIDDLRREARALRGRLADWMRSSELDAGAVDDLYAEIEQRLRPVLREAFGAIEQVHAALDPGQRSRLADLIDAGPRWAGPYRR